MSRITRVLFVVIVVPMALSACAPVAQTPFPTRTPIPTEIPTATVEWFPPTATPVILPTEEPSATPDSRAGLGALLFEDDFSDPKAWALTDSETRSAGIANGHLTLALSGGKDTLFTLRFSPVLANFYLQIVAEPNLCMGTDEYGLMLRTTADLEFFRFGISCNGQAHVDRIYKKAARAFAPWESFGVLPGTAPSSVRLSVRAEGSDLSFFANDRLLFSVKDTLFYQGSLGLYVRTEGHSPISVNFSELQVYSLP